MSLRLCLLADESRAGLFDWRGKERRKVRAIITQKILPHMVSSISDDYLPEHYPWCFVISPASHRGRCFYTGAFMLQPGKENERSLIAIYSEVSLPWLKNNMQAEFPLTFWTSRILNAIPKADIAEKNWRPLRQWMKALKRSYSVCWERLILTPGWQFKHHSQVLLREGSQEDYHIRSSDGVEVMPWKDWPDCIQQEASVWIWRQSRHRNILDSQRIPLRRAEAKPPDASF